MRYAALRGDESTILWALSLKWFNLISGMDSNYIQYKLWDEITYPIPNFKRWNYLHRTTLNYNGTCHRTGVGCAWMQCFLCSYEQLVTKIICLCLFLLVNRFQLSLEGSWRVGHVTLVAIVGTLYSDHRHILDPARKINNASDKYPTMHHFVTEICTRVHIYVTKRCIVGHDTSAWDLWNTILKKGCRQKYPMASRV